MSKSKVGSRWFCPIFVSVETNFLKVRIDRFSLEIWITIQNQQLMGTIRRYAKGKNMKVLICRTCGRQWVSSDFKWKLKSEREPPKCPSCSGIMNITGTKWVSWKCAKCGYSSGLQYCEECRYPKDPTDLRYFNEI